MRVTIIPQYIDEPGVYYYYVTQTVNAIESLPAKSSLTINQVPKPIYADDKTFCTDSGLYLHALDENITWYNNIYPDELFDSRDGRTYKTVKIGKQVWMAENLDIGTRIDASVNQTENDVIEKYYYNNDSIVGKVYGGLYQWDELMAYSHIGGRQGICPDGWHVPSQDEWNILEITLGMDPEVAKLLGLRGTDEGTKLKAGGSSGFEALMGGKRNDAGEFENLGYYGTFWSQDGYNRTLSDLFEQVYASKGDNLKNGFSVRCIMDDSSLCQVW